MRVVWLKFSTPLGGCQAVWMLDHLMYVSFCKELPSCLQQWLSFLAFPEAMDKNFCCSMSLSIFDIVLEFGHLITSYITHVTVILFCIFPDANYVEHLFICWFPEYVSSLVRYPVRSLGCFTIEFIFLFFGF